MPPSEPLIHRARAGDRTALGALWVEHRAWVAALLLAHRPCGAELEDLLEEVAVRLVANVASLREADQFRPWLRAIAVNVVRSHGRAHLSRHRTEPFDEAKLGRTDARSDDPGVAEILRHLRLLSADCREALLLQAVQGLTQREIAQTLGVPETTVESRLAREGRILREAQLESRIRGLDK